MIIPLFNPIHGVSAAARPGIPIPGIPAERRWRLRKEKSMQIIRCGIIGQGRSGRDIHASYLSKDTERYRIVAVADALPERQARARAEYGCEAYSDYEALLERDDLDLVVNASPSKFHVPI